MAVLFQVLHLCNEEFYSFCNHILHLNFSIIIESKKTLKIKRLTHIESTFNPNI